MAAIQVRKTPFRFKPADDIFLLKEVTAENPFITGTEGWRTIAGKCDHMGIDARRARERTTILVTQFRREDRELLSRSGTEEEYNEKSVLLQEISDLMSESEKQKQEGTERKKKKDEETREKALEIREQALQGLKTKTSPTQEAKSTKKRTALTDSLLEFMVEKRAAETKVKEEEINLRREELEFQKEKLSLERDRFEAERKEKEDSRRQERQERMALLDILRTLKN